MSDLATLVREHRERQGISQLALALELGITPGHVSNIETGHAMVPAWRVRVLARLLDVDVNTVLEAIEHTHRKTGVRR